MIIKLCRFFLRIRIKLCTLSFKLKYFSYVEVGPGAFVHERVYIKPVSVDGKLIKVVLS